MTEPLLRTEFEVRAACEDDLPQIIDLVKPFVARGDLLPRSPAEMSDLLPHAFVAAADGRLAAFAAIEIYSKKLSEIQGLSFDESLLGLDVAPRVIVPCVQHARERRVLEVMAVVPAALEDALTSCGFDYSLPNQKRALFIKPHRVPAAEDAEPRQGATIRRATAADLANVMEFIAPFVAQNEVLPRSELELADLLRYALVATAGERIVGFAALEIYSSKLSEIQCLSVESGYRRHGIGRRLVALCVQLARERHVEEVLAISARDEFFIECGFTYCLTGPRLALFIRTRDN